MINELNVLLIDDDPDDNLIHTAVLEESGLCKEISTFESATDAYDFFATMDTGSFPDLVFLDINMPKMNGFEFLDKIRSEIKHKVEDVIFIMLTTSLNPDDREKAFSYDIIWYYQIKPLTVE
jgi:CheY-like chemotaxis protein